MYQPCIQAFQRHVATCLLFGVLVLVRNAWASSEMRVISVNKMVTMSSTLGYNGVLWSASKAVDQNTNTDADGCNCCAATQSEYNPWLQVDLGKRYTISGVKLLGRTDRNREDFNMFNGLSIFLKQQSANMGTALKTITSTVHDVNFILENSIISQFVTIVLPGSSKLLLVCEISVMGKELPVSVNKTVTMSSTLTYGGTVWDASKAVDGNTNTNAEICHCCAATGHTTDPWLQVDLGMRYKIYEIKLLGRTDPGMDNFQGLQIFLRQNSLNMGTPLHTVPNADVVVDYHLEDITLSQFVTVVLPGSKKDLLVCEISILEDVDECTDNTNNCNALATCINTPGSFTCTCNLGYAGGGVTCTDADECTDNTDNCHATAACTNTVGSFTCTCNNGYTGDGLTCTDVDECTANIDNCNIQAACTNTAGSFTCACNSGYTGDGLTCTDVDECTDNTANCHANAACTNTAGSFTCACNNCYTGNGVTCTDINECTDTTDNCHENAACTNTPGSFTCACNSGYTGDGVTCTDVDECNDTTLECHANAACTNTAGSFTCSCNSGYTGNGVTCTDVDECFANTDDCHVNAECTNMPGSFTCSCKRDYTGNGVTCTVMNLIERLRTNVTTSISSQYQKWSSDKAIDGSNLTDPDTCDCCSGTQNAANSWWQLDLGQRYPIRSILLFGRINDQIYHQFEGFHLYLSNSCTTTEPPYFSDDMSSSDYFNVSVHVPDILVQFITVKRPGILTMCEIKVFEGDCPIGRYGDDCSQQCHCADDTACDRDTGSCRSPICKPGWRGMACNEEACERSNGECRSGCLEPDSGELCQDIHEDSSFFSATVIGYITGGVSFLVFLVCIVAVIIRKKRKESFYTQPIPQLSATVVSLYDTIRESSTSER